MHRSPERDVTLRCRVRTFKDEESYSLQASELQYDESQEMICKMYHIEVGTEWNIWESITFESVGRSLTPILMQPSEGKFVNDITVDDPNVGAQERESANSQNGPTLSFEPIATTPSGSPSRIRASSRLRRSNSRPRSDTSVSTSSGPHFEFDLPNPMHIGTHTKAFQVRHQSPDPSLNKSVKASKRLGSSPIRDSSNLAAAYFAVYSDDEKELACEPFDISLSDVVMIQKDYSRNAGIGVIYITTRTNGFAEIIPNSLHGRELLLAFLQASLPGGSIRDKDADYRQQLFVTASHGSFDMQDFEAHAMKERFANETFWDKMRRRSARFASQVQEMCVCCEHMPEDNDLVYTSDSKSDKDLDCSINTVESVLTEMELDILDEDKVMEDIKEISCDSKDQRDDSEHSDVF